MTYDYNETPFGPIEGLLALLMDPGTVVLGNLLVMGLEPMIF